MNYSWPTANTNRFFSWNRKIKKVTYDFTKQSLAPLRETELPWPAVITDRFQVFQQGNNENLLLYPRRSASICVRIIYSLASLRLGVRKSVVRPRSNFFAWDRKQPRYVLSAANVIWLYGRIKEIDA